MNERPFETTLCEEFERLVVDQSAEPLSGAQASRLLAHLEGCAACAAYARGLQSVEARARAELAPKDPGDAFFVRTRNEVLSAIEAQQRAARLPARARGVSAWLRRVGAWLIGERRGAMGIAAGLTAALLVAVFLWPKAARPPARGIEPEAGAPAHHEAPAAEDTPAPDAEVLPEISTLSRDELSTFASKLTIEASSEQDLDEDPEGVEGQVEGLSGDELRALDNHIALATKDPKGA